MSDEDTVRRINTWGVDSPDCAGERAVIYLLPEWVLPAEGHQAAAGQPQQGAAEPDRGDRRREPHEVIQMVMDLVYAGVRRPLVGVYRLTMKSGSEKPPSVIVCRVKHYGEGHVCE